MGASLPPKSRAVERVDDPSCVQYYGGMYPTYFMVTIVQDSTTFRPMLPRRLQGPHSSPPFWAYTDILAWIMSQYQYYTG